MTTSRTLDSTAREKRFNVEAAAGVLGVTHWTLRSWCRTGRLEHYKLGRKIFIAESELDRLISEAKVTR